ncbi:putative lipoprotein [Treponema primitia ZAS-2]|uniref:Putative lipoprotein n=1 Tax=Treponema primitia (strain ATCC BAA-887 / DSM 12427 / ZAS-2) TaxID=545694 RepID=F5YR91_TREPZ|nr:hypothetical protein [Treponema primitia]AEF84294.1 putative lipoprotein [Treponema primitia ZAS-2]
MQRPLIFPALKKSPLLFLAIFLILLPALSCSRAEPKIAFGTLSLVYFQGERGPEERFSFFVIPEDDDGVEDLVDLYLYHDREGLCWRLSSDDWVSYESEGQTWVGSRNIAMLDNEALPRGQFRAVLVDKGGEQTERLFTFDAPAEAPHPFPFLYVRDGRYRIESEYPVHYFICYDAEGAVLRTLTVEALEGLLSSLELPKETRVIALWDEESEFFTSALTNVVSIN